MQPALALETQNSTLPASAASARLRLGATMSMPWWVPPGRGSPKCVGVGRRPEDREDDLRRRGRPCSCGEGQKGEEEEERSSGCRPAAAHGLAKRQTLAEPFYAPR